MPPLTAEEKWRQLIVAATYLVNVVCFARTLNSTPFYKTTLPHLEFNRNRMGSSFNSRPLYTAGMVGEGENSKVRWG